MELGLHPEIQLMTGLAVDVSFTDGSWAIWGITKKAFPHVPVQKHFINISMASALCQRKCPVLAEKNDTSTTHEQTYPQGHKIFLAVGG